MEILLWLVPPVVVTVLAMAWVGWLGREGRGLVDRDEAARRIGVALEREPRIAAPRTSARERSTGVAVRRAPARTAPHSQPSVSPKASPKAKPRVRPSVKPAASQPAPGSDRPARRAS